MTEENNSDYRNCWKIEKIDPTTRKEKIKTMITPNFTKRHSLTSDERSAIMDKVKAKFSDDPTVQGVFGVAWELLYNQPSRNCALTAVIRNGGYELGLADSGSPGFTTTPVYLEGKNYAETQEIADWMNENVLLLDFEESARITLSSMRNS